MTQPGPEPQPGSGPPAEAGEPRWQYEIDADERRARKQARRDRLRNVGGPLGFFLLAVWKIGRIVLVAIGKVAVLFKIPILGTVLSGAVSIGAYAVFYGWSFAIGLVASLLVHELGHVVQIRREGLPIKAMNFVPFLGAYVLSEAPQTDDQQARVSIAGPIAGTLFAAALFAVAGGDHLLEAVAYTGFFLNLLNLIPFAILDGAGVGRVFTSGWWLIIAGATGGIAALTQVGFAVVMAFAALIMAYARREGGLALDPPAESGLPGVPGAAGVPFDERLKAAWLYVAVIAVCAFGMDASFRDRTDELVDQYGAAPAAVVVGRT